MAYGGWPAAAPSGWSGCGPTGASGRAGSTSRPSGAFGGLRQITVVNSPKGGAGKTVADPHARDDLRPDPGGYVLAWDNNETQGTLGMRAQLDCEPHRPGPAARPGRFTGGTAGRRAVAATCARRSGHVRRARLRRVATAGEMLTARRSADLRDVVSRFYKLIIVDTGNNVRAENWQAAMDATDQLVSLPCRPATTRPRPPPGCSTTWSRPAGASWSAGRSRWSKHAAPTARTAHDLPAIQRHFDRPDPGRQELPGKSYAVRAAHSTPAAPIRAVRAFAGPPPATASCGLTRRTLVTPSA